MTQARDERVLLNLVTSRPMRVFRILRGIKALRDGDSVSLDAVRQTIASDVSDVIWRENIDAAEALGLLEFGPRRATARLTLDDETGIESEDAFKRLLREIFSASEESESPNAILFSLYRLALVQDRSPLGTISLRDLVAFASRMSASDTGLRSMNDTKATTWAHWMRFVDAIQGANNDLQIVNGLIVRRVVLETPPGEFTFREFVCACEAQIPLLPTPALSASPGEVPTATCAALEALEFDGVLSLSGLSDADAWEFRAASRRVTHVTVVGVGDPRPKGIAKRSTT